MNEATTRVNVHLSALDLRNSQFLKPQTATFEPLRSGVQILALQSKHFLDS